jgi:hypothetical protein
LAWPAFTNAQCELGVRHSHPAAKEWGEELHTLTARADIQALATRAAQHASALG